LDKLELMDPHLQLALGSVHVLHAWGQRAPLASRD
jgi:hypothetical protein